MTTRAGSAIVDNSAPLDAALHIDHEQIVVRSTASAPDLSWTHLDSAGHFHSWAQDATLPTLTRHETKVPCDGFCGGVCEGEGYTALTWLCRICAEQVEPGTVPGLTSTVIPGVTDWWIQLHGLPDDPWPDVCRQVGRQVSVRFLAPTPGVAAVFGVAVVADLEYDSSIGWHAIVYGNGPLGERRARRPANAVARSG
jgi:hypothetical protein